MDFKKLKEFIDIAKEAGASKLSYEEDEKKFSISFQSSTHELIAHRPVEAPVQAIESKNDGSIEVTSPFVGTFYRSSSPGADPFVKVGDRVSEGQVLCIVEAMKIMNEIEAESSGEVVEICMENENYVEFGQVLFRIKP